MMNMEMMAGTRTVLIMGIEMRVGGRWSILFSTISMRTRHVKREVEREEKREEDEDVSGVNRMGRGPCVVGGDAYIPPTLIGINLFHPGFVIGGSCSHLTLAMSDNRREGRQTFSISLIIFYLLLYTLLPHPFETYASSHFQSRKTSYSETAYPLLGKSIPVS
jgi:hypothetical protein